MTKYYPGCGKEATLISKSGARLQLHWSCFSSQSKGVQQVQLPASDTLRGELDGRCEVHASRHTKNPRSQPSISTQETGSLSKTSKARQGPLRST